MVADMSVYFDFGGTDNTPGTEQDTDALGPPRMRFKRADNATIDSANPVTIPPSGTNYSRWKQIYLLATVAPDTQVDNIRIHNDGGGFGTGITVNNGIQFPVKTNALNTGYDVSDTDDQVMTNHTDITTQEDFFANHGSAGTALGPVTIGEAGGIINLANETCHYVVLQMATLNTATPGAKAAETITWLYDEI